MSAASAADSPGSSSAPSSQPDSSKKQYVELLKNFTRKLNKKYPGSKVKMSADGTISVIADGKTQVLSLHDAYVNLLPGYTIPNSVLSGEFNPKSKTFDVKKEPEERKQPPSASIEGAGDNMSVDDDPNTIADDLDRMSFATTMSATSASSAASPAASSAASPAPSLSSTSSSQPPGKITKQYKKGVQSFAQKLKKKYPDSKVKMTADGTISVIADGKTQVLSLNDAYLNLLPDDNLAKQIRWGVVNADPKSKNFVSKVELGEFEKHEDTALKEWTTYDIAGWIEHNAESLVSMDEKEFDFETTNRIIRSLDKMEKFITPISKRLSPVKKVGPELKLDNKPAQTPPKEKKSKPVPTEDKETTSAYKKKEKLDLDTLIFKIEEAKSAWKVGVITNASLGDNNAGLESGTLIKDIEYGIENMGTNEIFDEINRQVKGLQRLEHEKLIMYARIGALIHAYKRIVLKSDSDSSIVDRILEATEIDKTDQYATTTFYKHVKERPYLLMMKLPWYLIRNHYTLLDDAITAIEAGRQVSKNLADALAKKLFI